MSLSNDDDYIDAMLHSLKKQLEHVSTHIYKVVSTRIPWLDYDMFKRQLDYAERTPNHKTFVTSQYNGIQRRYEEGMNLRKEVKDSLKDLDKLSVDDKATFWVQYAFGFDMKRLENFFFTLLDRCEKGYGHSNRSTLLVSVPNPNDSKRYHSFKDFTTLWQSMTSFVSDEQRIPKRQFHDLLDNVRNAVKNQTPDFVMVLQMLLFFSDRLSPSRSWD